MKRAILIAVCVFGLAPFAAFAQTGLHLKVFGTGNLGIDGYNNYLRGFGGGAQLSYRLGILSLGLEAKAEYDAAFSEAAFPITLDLGLGDGFWIMAGTTLGPSPTLYTIPLSYRGFFNTFGLGLRLLNLNVKIAHLVLLTELTYTSITSANGANNLVAALGGNDLEAALLGFTGYVGVGLEFAL